MLSRSATSSFTRLLVVLGLASAAACLSGCLKRTLEITSTPSGALVWLNDVEVGRTPLKTDFTFYGQYDVRIRLDGYEPITCIQNVSVPLYEVPPVDLATEALPVTVHANPKLHFDLVRTAEAIAAETGNDADAKAARNGLLERGRAVRQQVGPTTPPAPAQPGPSDPAGTPTTTAPSDTGRTTTAPAPTTHP